MQVEEYKKLQEDFIKKLEDIEPCPYCNGRGEVYLIREDENEPYFYFVYCSDCDARGPRAKFIAHSIISWNNK